MHNMTVPMSMRPSLADLRPRSPEQLWIPFAGPQQAKERVRPLLQAMGGQGIFDFGEEVGAANIVKLVGNFLISSAGYSMREALSMAREKRSRSKSGS